MTDEREIYGASIHPLAIARRDKMRRKLLGLIARSHLESIIDKEKRPHMWDRDTFVSYLITNWDEDCEALVESYVAEAFGRE